MQPRLALAICQRMDTFLFSRISVVNTKVKGACKFISHWCTKLNPEHTESFKEIGERQTDMFGNKAKTQLTLEQPVKEPKEIVAREIIVKLVLNHEAKDIIDYED